MKLQFVATIGDARYVVNLAQPRSIAIPLRFDGTQLRLFGAPPARRDPYTTAGFIGDVRQGGSCNCDTFRFAAHLNGTHTECVGHISGVPFAIHEILKESLIPVTLVSIAPQYADATETYDPALRPHDMLITRAALDQALKDHAPAFLDGLVIRTTPNDPGKMTRDYDKYPAAFFSNQAIHFLGELGVKHLLADIPSVDRLDDEGKLTNHHIFWDVPLGHHLMVADNPSLRTITELTFVADDIADGEYLLNLQIAPFVADASPSRPILYELNRI